MSDSEHRLRVLYTGATGQLGSYLGDALRAAGYEAIGTALMAGSHGFRAMDIGDEAQVHEVIEAVRPHVVIHPAAYTDVDGCERDPEKAELINADGARYVARAAANAGAWMLAVGTDFVYSGNRGSAYPEDAPTDPVSVYGASKLHGEQAVLATDASFCVARTSWVFGGAGKHFPRTVLTMVRDRGGMAVVNDETSCPTFADDLADALVALVPLRPAGIVHLTNDGGVDRFTFAREIVRVAGGDPGLVTPTTTPEFLAKYPLPAKRPANSTLENRRARELGVVLPRWENAIARYIPQLADELGFPASGGEDA
jgi:dTDP-4-dehydrorhamnose reductase